jgi:hypothetical protein
MEGTSNASWIRSRDGICRAPCLAMTHAHFMAAADEEEENKRKLIPEGLVVRSVSGVTS